MTYTLRVNARNDLHLPVELLRRLNLGQDKIVKAELKGQGLVLVPVDLEPRYAAEELTGLDRLHEDEKKKGFMYLRTPRDIDHLLSSSRP